MSRSVIVLPDDSAQPILDAIAGATKSIRIKMFLFSDPSLLQAVIAAHKRGVDVRIMLNPARRDGKKENAESRKRARLHAGHRGDRQQPRLRPDPREIDGHRRCDRLCPVAELADRKPHRHARLRHRHHAQTRSR